MLEIIPMNRRNQTSVFNPFRDFYDFDKFFSDSFFSGRGSDFFKTDVKTTDNSYIIEADLPGIDKKDISVDLTEDRLTISAERHSDYEDKDKQKDFILRERSSGSYKRSFEISGIDTEAVNAKFENGVLTLTLPKKEPKTPVSRQLNID